jgi:ribonuclease P protein component
VGGHGLAHWERIRRRPEFEHAYDTGVRIQGRFMTVFVVPNSREVTRFGVAATRKLGSAVERNRAKRLARELFRHHKIAGLDIVIVPRREMLDAPFAAVEADYLGCLQRRDHGRPPSRNRQPRRGRRPRADSSV